MQPQAAPQPVYTAAAAPTTASTAALTARVAKLETQMTGIQSFLLQVVGLLTSTLNAARR